MSARVGGLPDVPPPMPELVLAFAEGPAHDLELMWVSRTGGITYRDGLRYLKFQPAGSRADLDDERARMAWARRWHPVPEVLDLGRDDTGRISVTRALPGWGAATPYWRERPRDAVRAVGEGLRALHENLPVSQCPFDWSAESRGGVDAPPVDRLVVCHGDASAPNTVVGADGTWSGHLDLENLGVADRWADLAVGALSLDRYYGPGWEGEFFAAYGVTPDADRMRYYRELWDSEADEPPAPRARKLGA